MKAKYINNRPAQLSNPEDIQVGDVIEENNPPRGVNIWKVLGIENDGVILKYTVEMLQGSAFTGSVYIQEYHYKTIGKIAPVSDWFFIKMHAAKSILS